MELFNPEVLFPNSQMKQTRCGHTDQSETSSREVIEIKKD